MTRTKYIVLIGDGMADYPLDQLGGRTPLEAAPTPQMDRIAACRIGLVRTIPPGMEPGSDVANLSLLGYDPLVYHTRRAPFEAASMGVKLASDDVAFRMNLVTLEHRSDHEIIMISHSSGDISAQEAAQIVQHLKDHLRYPGIALHRGVGYRHLLVWEKGPEKVLTIPPHDVLGRNMAPYLNDCDQNPIPELIRISWPLLGNHPVNQRRRESGFREANSIWLWGQGKAPRIPQFIEKYSLSGRVISAVDLIRGIGIYAGFKPIYVEGATGYLDTNYRGKAEAAVEGLKDTDFLFLHVEAPDEAGHAGSWEEKIEAIHRFDQKVVGTVLDGLKQFEDYRVMVASDHLTPIVKRTHTADLTPFAWASKQELENNPKGPPFTEASAFKSGLIVDPGYKLMDHFILGALKGSLS
ncbi:MAG: cofactor-independent phosphoglycerate mutase [Deltaproteobacteria bacterium]|nr:cofactor-independent phosphoglycerate mutase [Deltaproteobacteria bacterium]